MGFSGGGTSPVTAHKHTNASGQGGALEKLVTLVDSDTLQVTLTNVTSVFTTQRATLVSNFTTTSTSLVDITGITITLPSRTGLKSMVTANLEVSNDTGANLTYIKMVSNGVSQGFYEQAGLANELRESSYTTVDGGAGEIVKMQVGETGGVAVATVHNFDSNGRGSQISSIEVS
jgi:hypothetical protein